MISKKLHLYWGRNYPLSYLQWLTAKTFSDQNPDWKIKIYYPQKTCCTENWQTPEHKVNRYSGKDWFDHLNWIANTEVICVNLDYNQGEVIKSDLFRWKILYEQGGLWSDFDILFHKPVADLPKNKIILCRWLTPKKNGWVYPVGFMAGIKGTEFYQQAYQQALVTIKKSIGHMFHENINYQALGRYLLDRLLISKDTYDIGYFDHRLVYPYIGKAAEQFYKVSDLEFNPITIGKHWFSAGALSGQYMNTIDGPDKLKKHKKLNLFKYVKI